LPLRHNFKRRNTVQFALENISLKINKAHQLPFTTTVWDYLYGVLSQSLHRHTSPRSMRYSNVVTIIRAGEPFQYPLLVSSWLVSRLAHSAVQGLNASRRINRITAICLQHADWFQNCEAIRDGTLHLITTQHGPYLKDHQAVTSRPLDEIADHIL